MIKAGNKFIGNGAPCFIAAEAGLNHNGDMDLAVQTIDAAVEAGADAVKFQNYYTEDFILDKTLTYTYISQGKEITETQFEMFKRYELSFEQLKLLKEYCDKKGVIFFSTPTSKRGIDDLVKLKVPLLKNGSDLLVNLPLIKEMAKTGIPTIISTGMATVAEIDDAVRTFEQAGGKDLIILHCISSYPTPPDQVNLNKIPSLQKTFAYPVGFSDHTWGTVSAIGAVVLGACFIEKHFTLDKTLSGPDHRFSSDMHEFKELITAIRTVEQNLGISKLGPTAAEEPARKNYRLSCVLNKNLSEGTILSKNDITYSRPSGGLPPKLAYLVWDKKLKKKMFAGEQITLNDVDTNIIALRQVQKEDAALIFEWRNTPFIASLGSQNHTVSWEEHISWMENIVQSKTSKAYLILINDEPVGQVRFDKTEINSDICVISVYLIGKYTGKGLGIKAIALGCQQIKKEWTHISSIQATVLKTNINGQKGFIKAGFTSNPNNDDDKHCNYILCFN
jgi:N-acetylneuraminate synthase/N,N'-diacetyllegionaminate synthase